MNIITISIIAMARRCLSLLLTRFRWHGGTLQQFRVSEFAKTLKDAAKKTGQLKGIARFAAGTMIYGLRMTKIDGADGREEERKRRGKDRGKRGIEGGLKRVKRGQQRGKSINFSAD